MNWTWKDQFQQNLASQQGISQWLVDEQDCFVFQADELAAHPLRLQLCEGQPHFQFYQQKEAYDMQDKNKHHLDLDPTCQHHQSIIIRIISFSYKYPRMQVSTRIAGIQDGKGGCSEAFQPQPQVPGHSECIQELEVLKRCMKKQLYRAEAYPAYSTFIIICT